MLTSGLILFLQQATQSDSSLSSQSMHLWSCPQLSMDWIVDFLAIHKQVQTMHWLSHRNLENTSTEWSWKILGRKILYEASDKHSVKLTVASIWTERETDWQSVLFNPCFSCVSTFEPSIANGITIKAKKRCWNRYQRQTRQSLHWSKGNDGRTSFGPAPVFTTIVRPPQILCSSREPVPGSLVQVPCCCRVFAAVWLWCWTLVLVRRCCWVLHRNWKGMTVSQQHLRTSTGIHHHRQTAANTQRQQGTCTRLPGTGSLLPLSICGCLTMVLNTGAGPTMVKQNRRQCTWACPTDAVPSQQWLQDVLFVSHQALEYWCLLISSSIVQFPNFCLSWVSE